MGLEGRRFFLNENYEVREYHGWAKGSFSTTLKTAERIKGIPATIALGDHQPLWWIAPYRENLSSIHLTLFEPIGPFTLAVEAAVWLKLIADREDARL
jgi:hypothetical protein